MVAYKFTHELLTQSVTAPTVQCTRVLKKVNWPS
jgi:hypothetical protein